MNRDNTIIDVKDLLWRIFSSWKCLLIFVLVLSICITTVFYLKDLRDYNNQVKAQEVLNKELSDEEKEDLLSSLTDADRKKIESLLSASKTIDRLQSYMNNSLLMKLDPFNMDVAEFDYMISADSGNVTGTAGAIIDTYSRYVRSDAFLKAIQEAFSEKGDLHSINEMVQFNSSNLYDSMTEVVFCVRIILPNNDVKDTVLEAVQSELQEAYDSVSKGVGKHKLKLLKTTFTKNTDMNLSQNRMNIENTILNMSNTSANILANLSSDTLSVYNKIIASENSDNDSTENTVTIEKPGISPKKCLVAIIGSFILYALVYLAWIILRGRVTSADAASDNMDTKCIGEAYYRSDAKGIKALMNSEFVLKKRFGEQFDSSEQIDTMTKSIESRLIFEDIKDIDVIAVGHVDNDGIKESIDSLLSNLKEAKFEAEEAHFELNGHVTPDESMFVDMKNAIPVIMGSCTSNKEAAMLRDHLKDYEVNIPGIIYIESM